MYLFISCLCLTRFTLNDAICRNLETNLYCYIFPVLRYNKIEGGFTFIFRVSVPYARDMSIRFGGIRLFLAVIVACLASAAPAWSQATSTSSVSGLVSDEQGATIAGAEIRATELATSLVQTTTSNESGRYIIANMAHGNWQIIITKSL